MGLLNAIRKLLKAGDFFNSSSMLRFEKQEEYKTITGGIISLSIIILITVAFTRDILTTFAKTAISVTSNIAKVSVPTQSEIKLQSPDSQMFSLKIDGIYFANDVRYFDISAYFQYFKISERGPQLFFDEIKLVQCTAQHWKNIPGLTYSFPLQGVYCPEIGKKNNIHGSVYKGDYQRIKIYINKCQANPSQKPCASADELNTFWNIMGGYVSLNFYYLNTILNPDQPAYKQRYFEDTSYAYFGPTLGSDITLQIADYEITTDESIWPFAENKVDNGLFIPKDIDLKYFPKKQNAWNYATIQIVKSSDKYTYSRTVQKLSTIFSYIGGVISSLLTAFFIMNTYTSFSFEISLANEIFAAQSSQKTNRSFKASENRSIFQKQNEVKESGQAKQLRPGVFIFLKFSVFKFFKEKINKVTQWANMNYMDQCHQQMTKQLDIKRLIKRIIFLEHCINKGFDKDIVKQLVNTQPNSLQEIKKNRAQLDKNQLTDECSDMSHFIESKKYSFAVKKSRQNTVRSKIMMSNYDLCDQISGHSIVKHRQKEQELNRQSMTQNKGKVKQVQFLQPTILYPSSNNFKNSIRTYQQKPSQAFIVGNRKAGRLDIISKTQEQNYEIQEEFAEVPIQICDAVNS